MNNKKSFSFLNDMNNGMILNITNTIPKTIVDEKINDKQTKMENVPFVNICFSENNEFIATVDQSDRIFIFNLSTKHFWMLNDKNNNYKEIQNVYLLTFLPLLPEQETNRRILVGCKNKRMFVIDVDTGKILRSSSIVNHSHENQRRSTAEETSFNITIHNKTMYILFFCSTDVKVYDLENFQLKYELNHERQAEMYEWRMMTRRKTPMDVIIKRNEEKYDLPPWDTQSTFIYATFIAKTNKIMIGLSNDTIQIWSWGFKTLKQTINIQRLRKKYLKCHHITPLEPFYDPDEEQLNTIVQNITEENGDTLISDIKLSRNGFYCAITLQYINELLIFITSTSTTRDDRLLAKNTSLVASTVYIPIWQIFKIIKINNDFPILRTTFIVPWLPPYHALRSTSIDSKFLICYSKNGNLSVINVENLGKINVGTGKCHQYRVSPNGKMLCTVDGENGQISMFSVSFFLDGVREKERQRQVLIKEVYEDEGRSSSDFNGKINVVKKRLEFVHKEVNRIISREKLLPFLREHGSYPVKYRQIIWRTLLRLPQNSRAFMTLIKQGGVANSNKYDSFLHPCVGAYDSVFPLVDRKSLRNLKKTVSALAYWSNLFSHLSFLPTFVFPFLKLWPHDSISCFETVATVLVNQCQLWFEFSPLEPYNYLGMVENILSHYDTELVEFYVQRRISVCDYAWKLLQNALSEVLTQEQWFMVWDHIITNESYFLVFLVAAYNRVQKKFTMNCRTARETQLLLQSQSPNLDVKHMINMTYTMISKCPEEIHPKQYMKTFVYLQTQDNKSYKPVDYFPKILFETKEKELRQLRELERLYQERIRCLQNIQDTMSERMEQKLLDDIHQDRLQKIHQQFESKIADEEKNLANLRNLLLQYQQNICEDGTEVLLNEIYSALEKSVQIKNIELSEAIKQTKYKQIKDDTEAVFKERQKEICELQKMEHKLHKKQPVGEINACLNTYQKLIKQRQKRLKEMSQEK